MGSNWVLAYCCAAGIFGKFGGPGYNGLRAVVRVPLAGGAATSLHVRDTRNKRVVAELSLPAGTHGLVGIPCFWGTHGPVEEWTPLEHAATAPEGSCALRSLDLPLHA